MFDMVRSSIVLFFQGRLFADPSKVYRQLAIGVIITLTILLAAAFSRVPLWAAAAIAGFAGGVLQPILFKDLRFR